MDGWMGGHSWSCLDLGMEASQSTMVEANGWIRYGVELIRWPKKAASSTLRPSLLARKDCRTVELGKWSRRGYRKTLLTQFYLAVIPKHIVIYRGNIAKKTC